MHCLLVLYLTVVVNLALHRALCPSSSPLSLSIQLHYLYLRVSIVICFDIFEENLADVLDTWCRLQVAYLDDLFVEYVQCTSLSTSILLNILYWWGNDMSVDLNFQKAKFMVNFLFAVINYALRYIASGQELSEKWNGEQFHFPVRLIADCLQRAEQEWMNLSWIAMQLHRSRRIQIMEKSKEPKSFFSDISWFFFWISSRIIRCHGVHELMKS